MGAGAPRSSSLLFQPRIYYSLAVELGTLETARKILLVEDEALIALSETHLLRKHGYQVVTADSGEKAVEAVDSDPEIHLILMDIDLGPGMDGTQAAERILARHDLPIAFLSSHTEPEIVERTEGITSYGYIVKNSGDTVLLASLRMAFRLSEANQELKRQKTDIDSSLRRYEETAAELEKKHEELERYFSSGLDMLCIANTAGEFVRMNPEWERVLGYSLSELQGRPCVEFVHPDDCKATGEAIAMLDAGGEVTSFENRLRSKGGQYRWIEWRATAIGSLIYAAARDTTDRRRVEAELRSREEYLRITLSSIGDAVISTDLAGNVTRMNPTAGTLCGWDTEAATGRALTEVFRIVHAGTGEPVENPVAKVLATGNTVGLANHTMLISRDGATYQIADSAAPIRDVNGRTAGVVLVFRDVTQEYQVAQALADSEREMARAQRMALLGSWQAQLDSGLVTASDQAREIYGAGKETLTLEYVQALPLPEYRQELDTALAALVLRGAPYDVEFRMRRPSDQSVRWIHSIAEYDAEHHRVVGTIQDITERKQTRENELELGKRLQTIIDNSPLSINEIDADGRYVMVNQATCALLGRRKEELLGKRFDEVLPSHTAATFKERVDHVMGTGERLTVDDKLPIHGKDLLFRTVLFPAHHSGESRPGVIGMAYEMTREMSLLQEKDTLMKELNHRVKNNLAMVSSLIGLKELEVGGSLSDIKHQIDAIALIHEKLYQTQNVARISCRHYINDILASVFTSFTTREVEIREEIEDLSIPTGLATSVGLIVNEIATNAIKHGFTGTEPALFIVKMKENRNTNQYQLTLSNTGKPFPEEIDLDHPQTLGLRLISALTEQSGGTVELTRTPHPTYTLQFPAGDYEG